MASRAARFLLALGGLLPAGVVAFLVWAWTPGRTGRGLVGCRDRQRAGRGTEQDGTWTLRPADGAATTGIVFYPGARVEPAAYVPSWLPIVAEAGVEVVIPRMPLNLAVSGRSHGEDVLDIAPGIDRWFVGGRSPGGAMATSWAEGTRDGSSGRSA